MAFSLSLGGSKFWPTEIAPTLGGSPSRRGRKFALLRAMLFLRVLTFASSSLLSPRWFRRRTQLPRARTSRPSPALARLPGAGSGAGSDRACSGFFPTPEDAAAQTGVAPLARDLFVAHFGSTTTARAFANRNVRGVTAACCSGLRLRRSPPRRARFLQTLGVHFEGARPIRCLGGCTLSGPRGPIMLLHRWRSRRNWRGFLQVLLRRSSRHSCSSLRCRPTINVGRRRKRSIPSPRLFHFFGTSTDSSIMRAPTNPLAELVGASGLPMLLFLGPDVQMKPKMPRSPFRASTEHSRLPYATANLRTSALEISTIPPMEESTHGIRKRAAIFKVPANPTHQRALIRPPKPPASEGSALSP